jgi:protein-disulfide isomerase
MSEENKSFSHILSSLSPVHSFLFGIIGGLLVLCTIGFFILIPVVMNCDGTCKAEGITQDFKAPEKFSSCLDSNKYSDAIEKDTQLGIKLGVNGTPATFINGYLLSGALPYEEVKVILDEILAGKEPTSQYLARDEAGKLIKTTINENELENLAWKGDKNAKITMIEFSDFECPYCTRFATTMDQVLENYGKDIKFTFRNFPLSFHANAKKAAEAFECAKDQGKAFEMHDKLFDLAASSQLNLNNYKKAASELGLK